MGIYTYIAFYRADGYKVIGFSDYNPTPVPVTIYCRLGSD